MAISPQMLSYCPKDFCGELVEIPQRVLNRPFDRLPIDGSLKKGRHCEERSNLNAHASSDRCKIASSAEKAFSQ